MREMIFTCSIILNITFILVWIHRSWQVIGTQHFYNLHDLEKDDVIIVDGRKGEAKMRVIANNNNTRTVILKAINKEHEFMDGVWSYNSKIFEDRWAEKSRILGTDHN